jgi:hypothetical protein
MQRSCPYISVIDVNFPRLSSCPPKFAALKTLQKERERERERELIKEENIKVCHME